MSISQTQTILKQFKCTLKIAINMDVTFHGDSALSMSLLLQNTGDISKMNCSLFMMNQKVPLHDTKRWAIALCGWEILHRYENANRKLAASGSGQASHNRGCWFDEKIWAEPLSFSFSIICQSDASWSQPFGEILSFHLINVLFDSLIQPRFFFH